jgi:hypothetical protein
MVPENKQNRRYKLTLLAFKIIAIPHNTLLATFIKLLETVSKASLGIDCRRVAAIQERVTAVLRSIPKEAVADSFQKFYEGYQKCAVKDDDYFEGQ